LYAENKSSSGGLYGKCLNFLLDLEDLVLLSNGFFVNMGVNFTSVVSALVSPLYVHFSKPETQVFSTKYSIKVLFRCASFMRTPAFSAALIIIVLNVDSSFAVLRLY